MIVEISSTTTSHKEQLTDRFYCTTTRGARLHESFHAPTATTLKDPRLQADLRFGLPTWVFDDLGVLDPAFPPVTIPEAQQALRSLKAGKTCSADFVVGEMLRAECMPLCRTIARWCTAMFLNDEDHSGEYEIYHVVVSLMPKNRTARNPEDF